MVETSEQAALNFTENAKVVQVYDKGRFSTAVDGNNLYLLFTTKISRYNVIASFDKRNNVVVYDRDKANLFVNYSHEHFGKSGDIDKLPESQIIDYLLSYLEPDLASLIKFENPKIENDFLQEIISRYPEDIQNRIHKGLDELGVVGIQYLQAFTQSQIKWCSDRKYYYICLDTSNNKFEMTNSDFSKVIKNGSCGSWKYLLSNQNAFVIYFNRTDDNSMFNEDLELQVSLDMQGTPYAAASRFIKLEDEFTKALNELVDVVAKQQGTVDMSIVYYPTVEQYSESIAKSIRSYQKETDERKRHDIFDGTKKLYSDAYNELQKAQTSLRKLHEIAGIK
jgi:hypothetical protein